MVMTTNIFFSLVGALIIKFSKSDNCPLSSDTKPHPKRPSRIVDSHHHFIDTNKSFSTFLKSLLGPDVQYSSDAYANDVIKPLAAAGVEISGSVHVEAVADVPYGGPGEVQWVQSVIDDGRSSVKAIVGSCDLGDEDYDRVTTCLERLQNASPGTMRGVRWILDHVGTFSEDVKSATHIGTVRHDIDYLRGNGGSSSSSPVVPSFEKGFALLEDYGWTFDLQCAPVQLTAAADLISRHPNVPVVIDHLGKPRLLLGEDSTLAEPNATAIEEWREGMRAMAQLPNVYVKISMLGYIAPDWIIVEKAEEVIKSLVRETVEMFGPKRCMMALNWYISPLLSDADGFGTVGPSVLEFVDRLAGWLEDYSDDDLEWIFAKTAESFYSILAHPTTIKQIS